MSKINIGPDSLSALGGANLAINAAGPFCPLHSSISLGPSVALNCLATPTLIILSESFWEGCKRLPNRVLNKADDERNGTSARGPELHFLVPPRV